ncbi:MAG: hypothetical protein F6K62_03645 [Sphaerospermopsis sp. SIO1G2]|nr:hypothetical protein [Sphaerospermopsis sp. SIO1G1]NET70144.1 hypothetical protein [Sphaerospermopsis sp. SIO1G2]
MTYISMLKNIPELLNQPTGIAAIASVGIHGAIALIVPLMPVDSNQSTEANNNKTVGLMEFSPDDLARLPQTSENAQTALQPLQLPQQQQIKLPQFDTEVAVIPPLQTPSPTQTVLPVIPKSTSNYNLSYLPKKQAAPMFTQRDFRTQVSNFRVSSNLPRTTPRVSTPSVSPFVSKTDAQISKTQPLRVNKLPQVKPNNDISGVPLINPSADPIDINSTRRPREFTEFKNPSIASNTEVNPVTPAGLLIGGSMERKSKLRPDSPSIVSSANNSTERKIIVPTINPSEAQVQKNQRLLAKLNSNEQPRKAVQIASPVIKQQAVIRKTIATDNPEIEGTVSGQLVVDGDGKVLDIKFQGRKVTPQLQSRTRAFLSANAPKGDKQVSYYPFQLQFKNTNRDSMKGNDVQLKPSTGNNNQPVAEQQDRKNPTKNQAVVVPNSPPKAEVLEETPKSANDSTQNLIQKLRQVKQERQSSASDQ